MRPRSRRDRRKEVQKSVVSASPGAMFRDLPAALGRHAGGHHQGPADHPAPRPHVQVRGVDEQVGEPGVVQAAGEELLDALVNVLADPGDRGPGDPGLIAQGLDQVVDLARGDPFDPRGADHRVQGLVHPPARVEQGREEGSGPKLGNGELDLPGGGGHRLEALAVAPVGALTGARRGAARRSRRRPRRRPGPRGPAWSRRRKTSS